MATISGRRVTHGGIKGGAKVVVEPHRHEGVFIAKAQHDMLVTKNLVPGVNVYGEKRVSVDGGDGIAKTEYREWNPFRSKLAAAILNGVDSIGSSPGLACCTSELPRELPSRTSPISRARRALCTLSSSDNGSGRDLVNMAKTRTNVIPIVDDARHPLKYRLLVGMVDVIFAEVAQPDQARIVALNAQSFLKNDGHFVLSIKASCVDSTVPAEAVFDAEVTKLRREQLKPREQITLEPFGRDHACVFGVYR